ncbi:MAG: hypothetical protein E7337_00135 [Clostridiales bacterium]|nr:hypothetical protein [Clostridiales bacterium]
MKRKSFIVGIMLLCILLIETSALALSIDFYFENTQSISKSDPLTISTPVSRYTVYVRSGSNISPLNMFGARARRPDGTSASDYHIYNAIDKYEEDLDETFTYGALRLHGKKDSASSITQPLTITGSFTIHN